jgi:hypothetical protein
MTKTKSTVAASTAARMRATPTHATHGFSVSQSTTLPFRAVVVDGLCQVNDPTGRNVSVTECSP